MKKQFFLIAALVSAFALTSCGGGGGGDDPVPVAQADAVVTLDSATGPAMARAVVGELFAFQSGVAEFGTTGATSVTLTNTATTPNFTISENGMNASGVLEWGSCRFRIVTSTFVAPHPLTPGNVIVINNCQLRVNTAGQFANGQPQPRGATLRLNNALSALIQVTVIVHSNGTVTVNGQSAGSVTVAPLTGT